MGKYTTSADIDDFCRRMKVDAKTKIDIALLLELLHKFSEEQIAKFMAAFIQKIKDNQAVVDEWENKNS